ncbi:barstar family protein [Nocardia otitidiscaviarum]|uniref:barstar family protein n=1 Tax=Nocardia otitidiscaviarum TaxID=1823 RepID=UPI0009DF0D41|nr:barstar family protein [Nocardia otitidiscaviarum]MBF6133670.1 barstar family protein [Nocardia otitidiscaviarum]MBF6487698.1 barstar family protein [Nocardia otitidiscaviarum]
MPRPIPLSRFLSADPARTESAVPHPRPAITDSARNAGGTDSASDAREASGAAGSGADAAESAEPGPDAPTRPTGRTRTAAPTPVLGALDVSAPDFGGVRYAVPDGYTAREVRGRRMRTVAGVLDEFAAALQFPYYFGGNLDAFDDSLRDLDDCLAPARGYVIAVRDADELLADEPGQWSWFESAMTDAADYWARRGVVFRVVLQGAAPTGSAMVSLVLDTRDDD